MSCFSAKNLKLFKFDESISVNILVKKANLDLAEKNMKLAETQFWYGKIDYTTYLSIEDDVRNNLDSYISGLMEYNLSVIDFYQITGFSIKRFMDRF